jgi:hypothetical protein
LLIESSSVQYLVRKLGTRLRVQFEEDQIRRQTLQADFPPRHWANGCTRDPAREAEDTAGHREEGRHSGDMAWFEPIGSFHESAFPLRWI